MKTRASENVMISTMLQSRKRLEQDWSRMAENRRLYANDWSRTGAAMFCSSQRMLGNTLLSVSQLAQLEQ